jgi:hypothetical protein
VVPTIYGDIGGLATDVGYPFAFSSSDHHPSGTPPPHHAWL